MTSLLNSFLFWISSMLQIHRIKENWNVLNACYVTDVSYSLSHVALLPMLLYCYLPFNNGGSWVWVRCRNWQMLYVCLLPDSWCTGNRAYELLLFCWEQALVLTPWNKDPVIVHHYVQLFATPWTAADQASLSFTISWSFLKLVYIESVMPPNHLILCRPFLLLPSIFAS